MTTSQYTTKSSKTGKRGVQNTQTLVLPSAERPFITDLKAATRLRVNFAAIYNVMYTHVIGANIVTLMARYDMDMTDPDAWEQIRGRLATENYAAYTFVLQCEELIRLRVVHHPVRTLEGIYQVATAMSMYVGTQAAQAMANLRVNLLTGEYVGNEDDYEDEDDE